MKSFKDSEICTLYEESCNSLSYLFMIVDAKEKFNIITLNKSMASSFERTVNELIGKNILNILPSETAKIRKRYAKEAIKIKKPVLFEDERNGRFFLTHVCPLINDKNIVTHLLIFAEDITKRKRIESDLKKRENELLDISQKFQIITNYMTDLVFQINLTGKFTYVNPVSERYGYKPEEMIGKNFTKFVPKKEMPRYFSQIKRMISGEKIDSFESTVIHKNGNLLPTEFSGQMVKVGNKRYINGIMRNISERKKLENDRVKIDNRYKLILENSNCPVTYLDLNGKIVLINKLGAKNLKRNQEDLLGKSIYEILPEFAEEQRNRVNLILKTGKGAAYEDLIDLHYSKKWFLSNLQPVKDENGKTIGIQIFSIDITDQKEVEIKLRKSEEKWQSLVNNIPLEVRIIEVDKNGTIQYINRLPPERDINKVIGMNLIDFVTPNSQQIIKKSIDSVFNLGKPVKFISETITEDGDIIIYNTVAAPINENNSVKTAILISRDVTEEKTSELKLKENEEKFRILTDQSFMGLGIIQEGQIKYANDAIAQITGYSKDDLIREGAKILAKMIHPDYLFFVQNQLQKKLAGDKDVISNYSCKIISKNGEIKWVEIFSKTIKYKGKNADFITFIDITNKIESEKKLNLISSAVKQSTEGIAVSDLNGFLLFVNEAFATMHGYIEQEIIGKNLSIFHSPEQIPSVELANKKIQETGSFNGEIYHTHRNGKVFPTLMHNTLLKDEKGKPIGMIGTLRDITELKRAESEINRRKDYLLSVIDSASEIIFTINPDLKIRTWNNTAEQITGYKKRQVVDKSIKQLDIFDNSSEIIEYIKNIQNNKTGYIKEISINTIYGIKRIFSVSPSYIKDESNKIIEVLFVCRDITKEFESYGKIQSGISYIIQELDNKAGIDIFNSLLQHKKQGLYIGRISNKEIHSIFNKIPQKIIKLTEQKDEQYLTTYNMQKLYQKIEEFIINKKNTVILFDRIDYLIINNTFESVMKILYKINDLIQKQNSILLMQVNPSIINQNQIAILNAEFKKIPSQEISDIQISKELYEILTYIQNEFKNNISITYGNIGKTFSISKVTAKKRLESLIDSGLIYSRKQGKSKILNITEKGKNLLNNRAHI